MNFAALEKTKVYDFVMAVPLMLWFGRAAVKVRPALAWDANTILDGRGDAMTVLHFSGLAASLLFNLLLIWLLVARDVPRKKSTGLLPRLCAIAGTFLSVGILQLDQAQLSLPLQLAAQILTLAGGLGSVLVLWRLGQSFSVMPEARALVREGPYAYARHPLYAVEMLTLTGIALQFQQPWAGLLAVGTLILQVARSVFEERVLLDAYPEYAAYRARTARFIPGLL
jgi:protein-S-isoprenylcysteine O-methyltransferase Ste14